MSQKINKEVQQIIEESLSEMADRISELLMGFGYQEYEDGEGTRYDMLNGAAYTVTISNVRGLEGPEYELAKLMGQLEGASNAWAGKKLSDEEDELRDAINAAQDVLFGDYVGTDEKIVAAERLLELAGELSSLRKELRQS